MAFKNSRSMKQSRSRLCWKNKKKWDEKDKYLESKEYFSCKKIIYNAPNFSTHVVNYCHHIAEENRMKSTINIC